MAEIYTNRTFKRKI